MLLAQEIPTSMLGEWSSLSDFDFVLAHKVLEDTYYAEFFKSREKGREVLLDNSYHELGVPLAISDLLEAAQRVNANYVITPDRVGDVEFNSRMFKQSHRILSPQFRTAVVMTGSDKSEILDFLIDVRDANMLCLTFKDPQRFEKYKGMPYTRRWGRVHLLGVSEFEELDTWNKFLKGSGQSLFGQRIWSVDTGKAIKWALKSKKLDELASLRTNAETTTKGLASEASQKLLDVPRSDITEEVDNLFRHNVQVLRSHLGD